jgi:low temperature requirement protein LtrA
VEDSGKRVSWVELSLDLIFVLAVALDVASAGDRTVCAISVAAAPFRAQ